uniref:MFS domain-containing protein n=1 Tax=Panagrellus redivivus TaxID=6233 RepID=A0A7E4ZWD6_PANRE
MSLASAANMVDAEVQVRPTSYSCGGKTRFIVMTQGALMLAILMSSIVCWNPAMIVLIDVESSPIYDPNLNQTAEDFNDPSLGISERRIPYTTVEKSTLFAGIYVGALAGVVPMNWIHARVGTRKAMILIGSICVITTALTPIAAIIDFKFLVVVRICQGVTLSNPYPVIGAIASTWSAISEAGIFVSMLTGYLQISTIFTMPISGVIASELGWDAVFYVHAAVGAVLVLFWTYNFRDEPFRHHNVSDNEFNRIISGKDLNANVGRPPYRKIFTDIHIWVVWIATAANFLVAQFAITYMPMFFVYVCGLDVSIASVISAVPFLMQFIFKFVAGIGADYIPYLSEVNKVRFFNTLAFWGSGILMIVCALIPPGNALASVITLGASMSMLGFNSGGFTKDAVLVAKQHSPTVMAVMQVILCLSLFAGSYIVPGVTPHGTHEQYSIIFYIYAGVLIISNLIFCIFCSGKPASWTVPPTPAPGHSPDLERANAHSVAPSALRSALKKVSVQTGTDTLPRPGMNGTATHASILKPEKPETRDSATTASPVDIGADISAFFGNERLTTRRPTL